MKAGFAVCHQATTLDWAKLTRKAGTLPLELLDYTFGNGLGIHLLTFEIKGSVGFGDHPFS
jgi:hypothetical protein